MQIHSPRFIIAANWWAKPFQHYLPTTKVLDRGSTLYFIKMISDPCRMQAKEVNQLIMRVGEWEWLMAAGWSLLISESDQVDVYDDDSPSCGKSNKALVKNSNPIRRLRAIIYPLIAFWVSLNYHQESLNWERLSSTKRLIIKSTSVRQKH